MSRTKVITKTLTTACQRHVANSPFTQPPNDRAFQGRGQTVSGASASGVTRSEEYHTPLNSEPEGEFGVDTYEYPDDTLYLGFAQDTRRNPHSGSQDSSDEEVFEDPHAWDHLVRYKDPLLAYKIQTGQITDPNIRAEFKSPEPRTPLAPFRARPVTTYNDPTFCPTSERGLYCLRIEIRRFETEEDFSQGKSQFPQDYAWTSRLVTDLLGEILPRISETFIAVPGVAILFFGHRNNNEGLNEVDIREAKARCDQIRSWCGKNARCHSMIRTIEDGRAEVAKLIQIRRRLNLPDGGGSPRGAGRGAYTAHGWRSAYTARRVSAFPNQASDSDGPPSLHEDSEDTESDGETTSHWESDFDSQGDALVGNTPVTRGITRVLSAAGKKPPGRPPGRPRKDAGKPSSLFSKPPPPPPPSDHPSDKGDGGGGRKKRPERRDDRGGGYGSDWSQSTASTTTRRRRKKRRGRKSPEASDPKGKFSYKIDLPVFDDIAKNAKVTYVTWRFDVQKHRKVHSDDSLLPHVYRSLQGFPGELARSLGDDITLKELVEGLDDYFGVVIDYDAMCRALYNIKQDAYETVAEFAVRLCRQLCMLKHEFPEHFSGTTELEEEIKRDRFFGGLRPALRSAMNYTKSNGPNGGPSSYKQLLVTARQLEAETDTVEHQRDYNPKKPVYSKGTTGPGAPPAKQATARMVKPAPDPEPEPDSNPESKEGESDSFVDSETEQAFPGITARVAAAVRSYQQRTGACFNCQDPTHWARECPRKREVRMSSLNGAEGPGKKGPQVPLTLQKKATS